MPNRTWASAWGNARVAEVEDLSPQQLAAGVTRSTRRSTVSVVPGPPGSRNRGGDRGSTGLSAGQISRRLAASGDDSSSPQAIAAGRGRFRGGGTGLAAPTPQGGNRGYQDPQPLRGGGGGGRGAITSGAGGGRSSGG